MTARDTHCSPCVGCTRSCYDLQPATTALTESSSKNNPGSNARLMFAAAMPWFCLAFFTQPHLPHLTVTGLLAVYGRLGLITLGGAVVGMLADRSGPWSRYQVIVVHAALAVSIYYLFVVPTTLSALHIQAVSIGLLVQGVTLLVAVLWLRQALARELSFKREKPTGRRLSSQAA
jgi:hypothetical protein